MVSVRSREKVQKKKTGWGKQGILSGKCKVLGGKRVAEAVHTINLMGTLLVLFFRPVKAGSRLLGANFGVKRTSKENTICKK